MHMNDYGLDWPGTGHQDKLPAVGTGALLMWTTVVVESFVSYIYSEILKLNCTKIDI